VTKNGTLYQSYAYDGNGNRTSVTAPSTVDSLTYDKQDRLLSFGLLAHSYTRYVYTTSGELSQASSSGGTSTYTYDQLGNLTNVTVPGSVTIQYLIDGANRRVGKIRNGTFTKGWLYQNGLNVVAEVNNASVVTSRFVYGSRTNVPDYMVTVDSTYRIVSDDLGSVRLVVNASSGVIAQRLDYDAWGKVLTDTNAGFQPFGFAGGLYDPDTKLVRFGARDYDASVGRWTCKDPAGFEAGATDLWTYADDEPVNNIDPWGTTYASNFCFLIQWVIGTGPRHRTYSPGDIELEEMKRSPGAAKLRKQFRSGDNRDLTNGTFGTYEAYWRTILSPREADWSKTSAQVGGYAGATVRNNGDGTATYEIHNEAGTYSFFLHAVPNAPWKSGPMSTIGQDFRWTEPIK
jgi:RHS repeat-associated protein